MIEMTYHNDGKRTYHSHEIQIAELDFYNAKMDVWSRDPFCIIGYGETKEEAIEDFKNKFKYVMDELRALETMLLDTDIITDNIIEVDCMGKPINGVSVLIRIRGNT